MANLEFTDPSDNHVGLDLGSPLSVATVNLAASGIDLKSGNVTTAWIDYCSVEALGTTATNPGLEADYLMPPIDSAQKRRDCMCETRLIFICDALNM